MQNIMNSGNQPPKAAVLGAGVMGSQIAAHLANAGISSLLFDISQDLAEAGIKGAANAKPAAFYSPRYTSLITPCNFEQHLNRLKQCGIVLEAIIEKADIKKGLFLKILPFLREDCVICSNTSGLQLHDLMADMPSELRQRFMITHFFNPPRYMHLLEIVAGEDTHPEIVKRMVGLGENVLGKGIVYAKDTPNFVANRIGVFSMMLALRLTRDLNLTVEEVDQLTGPVIGRPKSATYRTADLVGLDTLMHVANTSYQKCPDDEMRELFAANPILKNLVENKRLGAKTGQGFYQKKGKDILSLDFDSMEYAPQKRVRMDGLRAAKRWWSTPAKTRALISSNDPAGKFTWELLANTLIYSANRIPEITDDIVNIDNAMKWGFGWELGPFETWDSIGLPESLERMANEGKPVPGWVRKMVEAGRQTFYLQNNCRLHYFEPAANSYQKIKEHPKIIRLNLLRNSAKELRKNWNASLLDLGDGIALVEFHSIVQPQMNVIDGAMLDMISEGLDYAAQNGLKGLVIGHRGQHFSAGANLALILRQCEDKNWASVENFSRTLQELTQKIRYSPIPVVAAPFNMCLGGGFEISGACAGKVASAELYCGLVETGVGLIPGGGGNLRLLLNNREAMSKARPGPFPIVQKTFETIGFAKVSTSAKEAVFLGFLTKADKIVINPDHLISEAKQEALRLAENYQPPEPEREIYLPGQGGRLAIEFTLENLQKAGKISPHDALIGRKLAYVLTGGEKASYTRPVDEQYLLDLEREAFVSLCAEPLSIQRMVHTLKTGKPLRN